MACSRLVEFRCHTAPVEREMLLLSGSGSHVLRT